MADISGKTISDSGLAAIAEKDLAALPKVAPDTRLGPCVTGTGKFICISLNYADDAAEGGMEVPPEPVIFMKACSAICGPNDPIIIPGNSTKTDWEVELAVIIGKNAKYVSEADALDHVAGYAVTNDVSERAFQLERSGQRTKGNSCDNHGQIDPWMVTRDNVTDPQNLRMRLTVNGKTMQDGSTNTMVYGVAYLVSYLSQFMSLHPGDVISTGTSPGIGMGQHTPQYLRPGDIVDLGIEGLGQQWQTAIADPEQEETLWLN